MGELSHAMHMAKNVGLSIIQYPSGRFGFAGKVPLHLAFEYSDMKYVDMARQHGLSLAQSIAKKEGGFITSRAFETREAAEAAKGE